MRPLYISLIHLLLSGKILAWPPRCYSWFGHPDPAHCEALILGGTDIPGHNDGRGIDYMDTYSHAFTLTGATREGETDEQWENWVWIPKVFSRDEYPNCKIALLPFDASEWRFSRDTRDRRALSMIIFAPGSEFDVNTAQNLNSERPVAFRRWRDDGSSDDKGERAPPRKKQRNGGGENTAWGAGPSSPGVRGLGNNWVFDYGTIHGLVPSNRAAAGLSRFYDSVIETATTNLANATVERTDMVFASEGLNLRFSSSESIEWLWVVRFVEAMATSLTRGFTMLYDKAIAENLVWEVATVLITLSAA
ncbi:MAG: hypothetical protein Q9199_001332 [Rusavskia elegans]